MSSDYWALVAPTYIEAWPPGLHRLSLASIDVPLTREETLALGSHTEMAEAFRVEPGQPLDALIARVDEAVQRMPKGAFVRLGSRSPKDSFAGYAHGFRVSTGAEAVERLCDSLERIPEDLLLALDHDYLPHIWVRPWLTIPAWAEFRCFQRGRRLIGISQYQYLDDAVYPEIGRHAATIRWAIERFHERFRLACHLPDVVCDVVVRVHEQHEVRPVAGRDWLVPTTVTEVKLLEINPFFELTDPCLFEWNRPELFDGRFLFRVAEEMKAA